MGNHLLGDVYEYREPMKAKKRRNYGATVHPEESLVETSENESSITKRYKTQKVMSWKNENEVWVK